MYSGRQSQGWQNTSKSESARRQHSKGSKKKHFKLSALKLFAKARVPVLTGRVLQASAGTARDSNPRPCGGRRCPAGADAPS